ncbi:M16 family metallopeptidase [Kytococcus sp. Marseille-QA3725]
MSTPDRTTAPGVETPRPWAHPDSTVHELDGARSVRVFEMPGQPVVCVEITLPMPWAAEPRELEGIGVIVAATLEEGTQDHSADELARAFERAGVDLGISSTELGLVVSLEMTPEHLTDGLDLVTELLARPTFPEAAVAREVRGRLFDIAQEMNTPAVRAAREFAALLHGPEARAGRPGAGSAETVQAVTRSDVVAHHRAWVRPAGAQVVVAGPVGASEVVAAVQEHLVDPWREAVAGWEEPAGELSVTGTAPGATTPASAAASAPGTGGADDAPLELLVIERRGAAQTEVRLGWIGPTRHVEGGYAPYAPLAVHVGASPTSLLDEVLREEKGWTYGMRAAFRPRAGRGEFMVSGSFTTEATAEAVHELVRLLRGVDAGIEEADAVAARDFALLTAPMRYATGQVVAHEAAVLGLDGLSPEFTTRTLAELAEVDAAAMTRAWRRWSGGRWVMVLVGDHAVWGAGLDGLTPHTRVLPAPGV